MIKRIGRVVYIVLAMAICLIPFAGMAVHPTTETTEKKELAQWPLLIKDGQWNQEYMQEAGAYFDDHFAFRQELVTADARLRGGLFGVSASDQVILGTDGWLYYEATANDYLRLTAISDRAVYNIAHNVALMQQYVESQGAQFIFTIAPNKNSLYGDHMPYYYQPTGQASNAERLKPFLEQEGVHYLDLFEVFEAQPEELYLKRDSHWNNKGALLAYRTLMEQAGQVCDGYEQAAFQVDPGYLGDLNQMLYPLNGTPEENQNYEIPQNYAYVTETESVEDSWIQTINPTASGSLLMYRDSFGNTLLPLISNAYANVWYSKLNPYSIQLDMEACIPDTVIVERVERQITALGQKPPYMEGPVVQLGEPIQSAASETTVSLENAGVYYGIQGIVDKKFEESADRIYIRCTDAAGTETVREAFTVTRIEGETASDYGYQCYIRQDTIPDGPLTIEVLIENQGQLYQIARMDNTVTKEK